MTGANDHTPESQAADWFATREGRADWYEANRDALVDLGRALAPAAGRAMTLAAARATSAYQELHEGLFYLGQLSPSRQVDVLDLAATYPLDIAFDTQAPAETCVEYLELLAPAIADHGCPAEWSVCPEHGNWLSSSGGETRCRVLGCDRVWRWDRLDAVCGRRATHTLATPQDDEPLLACTIHAEDARVRVDNVTVTPITQP